MRISALRSAFVAVCLVTAACATTPYADRSQLILMDIGAEMNLGAQSYREEIAKVPVAKRPDDQKMVLRVAMAIAKAASKDPKVLAYCPDVAKFQWEATLVENAEVNANCRPGGKVIVYTGILPVTQSEAGLAAVLGHEIAHAVCRHSNERVSQNMIAQLGMTGFQAAVQSKDPATQSMLAQAIGVGVQYGVLLPFSRAQESEADHLGLILMAKAGYDPHEAEAFWTRMSGLQQGSKPPEFLSTHPSDETRVRQIREWMPEALKHYGAGAKSKSR